MDNEHVISGLIRKHAEIEGEIMALNKKLRALSEQKAAIALSLKTFDPNYNHRLLPPIRPKSKSRIFPHGTFARGVLEVMRDASCPLTVREITNRLLAKYGIELSDTADVNFVLEKVRKDLHRRKGRLFVGETNGAAMLWFLSKNCNKKSGED
jgi:hypothetical protein